MTYTNFNSYVFKPDRFLKPVRFVGTYVELTSKFNPITPITISVIDMILIVVAVSLNHKKPIIAIKAVPKPDHTAYAILISIDLMTYANRLKPTA